MLKFYFGHLMRITDSLEKTLMWGKSEGRRRGWQKMRWSDGITNPMDKVWPSSGSWWWTGKPGALQSMGLQTWLGDWTESPSLFNPFFSPYHPCPHPICFYSYHANRFIYIILLDYTYVHVIFAYFWYLFKTITLSLWVYFSLTWDLLLTCSSQWTVKCDMTKGLKNFCATGLTILYLCHFPKKNMLRQVHKYQ